MQHGHAEERSDRDGAPSSRADGAGGRHALAERLADARGLTGRLARGLSEEDQLVQSMPEASPTKWHLAHTTWFFETFVLEPHAPAYRAFDPRFRELFNSYYETVGPVPPRPRRGLMSRPSVSAVMDYRAHVDAAMGELLARGVDAEAAARTELGIQHEQQHQELILTDILHAFASSPLRPSYREATGLPSRLPNDTPGEGSAGARAWLAFDGGAAAIGHADAGFSFDNERPRHDVLLRPFEIAPRPVTCGEWKQFVADGGYERPDLWLSDGWTAVCERRWRAPLYWERADGAWRAMTLDGPAPIDDAAPVCHVSYYEADAYARWCGARLPTEAEWEVAAAQGTVGDNTLGTGALRPLAAAGGAGLSQLIGDVWEWTASPYAPYPGYRPPAGAIGEYNGKFMCNQMVLRGGSALTPDGHVRTTYRNFFYPDTRWQMAGLRLARDADGS